MEAECPVKHEYGDPGDVLGRMSDDEVERTLLELQRHLNAASAWFHHAVAEFDRRHIADREYVLSTTQWVRRFCRLSASAAATTLRTARALDDMPVVGKVARAGDLTGPAVRQIAAARMRHPGEFPLHEPVFADVGTYLGPAELRTAIAHWSQQVDDASGLVPVVEQRRRRRLAMSQTYEGMWSLSGMLDAESGHVVATALRAIADPGNLDADDARSHPQRMADAAAEVGRFWLDHNETVVTSGGEKPHVTVVVDYTHLVEAVGPPATVDAAPITHEALRRLTCDAGVVRVVRDGDGQPLDVGRRVRTVTPAIRRALDLRDGGCTWDGCDAPAGWCDAHHLVHWADGGPTSVDNMALLCRRHHTATHLGRHARRSPMSAHPPDP
jgi:hypothetical protein